VGKRLKKVGAVKGEHYRIIGMPITISALHKLEPFEFQNWVIGEIPGARASRKKTGDMGIDGYIPKSILHKETGIQIKQSENIGRNVIDNFKSALDRKQYKKGIVVAFSFSKGASEEVARLKNTGELDISLITIEELLKK
jgi:predicted helicase